MAHFYKNTFYSFIALLLIIAGISCGNIQNNKTNNTLSNINVPRVITDSNSLIAATDKYMASDRYDSAQVYLDHFFTGRNMKQVSFINSYALSRQAEVYYYNNLHAIGIEVSRAYLDMAKQLNDSLLIADAYNFIGLFLSNMDSCKNAIPFFQQALLHYIKVPSPSMYEKLTRPHHSLGDIAETFEKLQMPDSAIYYARKSFIKATEIDRKRGEAVALQIIAKSFDKKKWHDSARNYYAQSMSIATIANETDVVLIGYGGLAKSLSALGNYQFSRNAIDSGLNYLENHNEINAFYANDFLKLVLAAGEVMMDFHIIADVKTKIIFFDSVIAASQDKKLQNLFRNISISENQVLKFELTESAQQKKQAVFVVYLLLAVIMGVTALFFLYRNSVQQKIKTAALQQKLSEDLHDDIGATLSSINIYGDIASEYWHTKPEQSKQMIEKISSLSKDVLSVMGDIIWSLKPSGGSTHFFQEG